jgi:hypothetical protein
MKYIFFILFLIISNITYSQTCTEGNCVNGKGTYIFSNGTIYIGEWKDTLFNGKGVLTCTDGMVYNGEWKNAKKNGFGSLTYATGQNYTGYWRNGEFHGQGVLTLNADSILVGEWRDGILLSCMGITPLDSNPNSWKYSKSGFTGKGRMKMQNGDLYEGDWKNGWMTGNGIYINVYGEKYEGQFKQGIRNGWGTCSYTDIGGSKYVGNWKHGLQNGQGTLYSSDGSTFVGTFKDEGWWNGTFTEKNGKKYIYKNGNEFAQ